MIDNIPWNNLLSSAYSFHQLMRCKYFHLRETKPFLAQILDRSTDVINIIIYTKEAVVRQPECLYFNLSILSIMAFYVKLKLTANLLCIDDSIETPCSVNACGRDLLSPPQLEVPFWHFKFSNSSLVNWNSYLPHTPIAWLSFDKRRRKEGFFTSYRLFSSPFFSF